jgi:hypothetical protein
VASEREQKAIEKLNEIVDAWESLPGGRQVKNKDIEKWLGNEMNAAINSIREFLGRPKPTY